jgi:predicted metal-dependent phosphoesterase TrpH
VKESDDALPEFVRGLKDNGLGGIEVHYSTHTHQQTARFLELAKRFDLLVTGGSDFHGLTKPDIEVGTGRGNLKVPERLLAPLKEAALRS